MVVIDEEGELMSCRGEGRREVTRRGELMRKKEVGVAAAFWFLFLYN